MVEPEAPQALSSRKLVLETAKYNVITAYSGNEGLELLEQFPAVTAVIVHGEVRDIECETLVERMKKRLKRDIPFIVLTPRTSLACGGGDHYASSHEPTELLGLLREHFGDARPLSERKSELIAD